MVENIGNSLKTASAAGKNQEVAQRVDIGKVAEKIVKNVSWDLGPSYVI